MRTLRPASARSLGEHLLLIWGERSEPTVRIQVEYRAHLARWGTDADAFRRHALHMRGGLVVTLANITNPAPLEQPTPLGEASRQVAQAVGRIVVVVHGLRTLPDTVARRLDSMNEVESARRQRVTIEMPDGEEVMP